MNLAEIQQCICDRGAVALPSKPGEDTIGLSEYVLPLLDELATARKRLAEIDDYCDDPCGLCGFADWFGEHDRLLVSAGRIRRIIAGQPHPELPEVDPEAYGYEAHSDDALVALEGQNRALALMNAKLGEKTRRLKAVRMVAAELNEATKLRRSTSGPEYRAAVKKHEAAVLALDAVLQEVAADSPVSAEPGHEANVHNALAELRAYGEHAQRVRGHSDVLSILARHNLMHPGSAPPALEASQIIECIKRQRSIRSDCCNYLICYRVDPVTGELQLYCLNCRRTCTTFHDRSQTKESTDASNIETT